MATSTGSANHGWCPPSAQAKFWGSRLPSVIRHPSCVSDAAKNAAGQVPCACTAVCVGLSAVFRSSWKRRSGILRIPTMRFRAGRRRAGDDLMLGLVVRQLFVVIGDFDQIPVRVPDIDGMNHAFRSGSLHRPLFNRDALRRQERLPFRQGRRTDKA